MDYFVGCLAQDARVCPRKDGMTDIRVSQLQLWESGPSPAPAHEPGSLSPLAARELVAEVFDGVGRIRGRADPLSLQWFLNVENVRHSRHGRWIPRLLEFHKHANETLLGLGPGLGTDWVQYARHGSEVVVCSPALEQLALVRRNFGLRDLPGLFLHASPVALPLEPASIDVVCLTGLLEERADPRPLIDELYRVLKPGGKVLAVLPALYAVDYWRRGWLPRQRPAPGRLAFTARSLRRLCGRFVEHRVYKRQLRRSETPHLWRWLPLPLLERLFGRVLVLKTFKPLSAAMALQAAA
jgi:SAM-dependent methyltransferase